jgi:NAD(P)H-dependent FMN reductase
MSKLNIGIVTGTVREGRVSPQVAAWVKEVADQRNDANYEIVDLKDFNLGFLSGWQDVGANVPWNNKLKEFDGYIFITAEYNHSLPGVFKNALDLLKTELASKAAGIVSYGSLGGARAAEHLRNILAELQVATVRTHPALSLFNDFENMSVFKPLPLHKDTVNTMLDQLIPWSTALKTVR